MTRERSTLIINTPRGRGTGVRQMQSIAFRAGGCWAGEFERIFSPVIEAISNDKHSQTVTGSWAKLLLLDGNAKSIINVPVSIVHRYGCAVDRHVPE